MIVDASAVLSILFREEDAQRFAGAIEGADMLRMSVVNYVEAAVRIDGLKDAESSRDFDEFMRRTGITLHAVTPELADGARSAYRRYGKGNHDARLNLGDCFAYALAKATGESLLFKGDDFSKTDIRSTL